MLPRRAGRHEVAAVHASLQPAHEVVVGAHHPVVVRWRERRRVSAAVNMDPAMVKRVESRLGFASGEVEVIDFHEQDNRFRARYRKPDGSLWGMTGLWVVPPAWKSKAKRRPARRAPRPETWSPSESLHRLRPRTIERIEVSYRQEAGAIGRGDLRIRDFQHVREDVYRVDVYIPASNYQGAWVGLLLKPMRRPDVAAGPALDTEDFAAVVRVFAMLLRRDRELGTGCE